MFSALAKSAQVFFHTWLPDAIEGPTPVSALIHAATIVTAGIYLLLILGPILTFSGSVNKIVIAIGLMSSLFSAIIGLTQIDLKRVIAFSTGSQLGLIITSLAIRNFGSFLSLAHLSLHALFKAGLFLSRACILHTIFSIQDLRRMGLINLSNCLPVISLRGCLSLIALPLIAGSYSKENIILGLYSYSS